MVYEWCSGFRTAVNAQQAGEIMQSLADKGMLTAQNLVEIARPESSPLHKGFEWDDIEAAKKYRRQQATIMIRAITVSETEVVSGGNEAITVKVFNLTEKGESYQSLKAILLDDDSADCLMLKAKAELSSFRAKYNQLKRLAKIMGDIDELLEETI